jgi:hypothetical protein
MSDIKVNRYQLSSGKIAIALLGGLIAAEAITTERSCDEIMREKIRSFLINYVSNTKIVDIAIEAIADDMDYIAEELLKEICSQKIEVNQN